MKKRYLAFVAVTALALASCKSNKATTNPTETNYCEELALKGENLDKYTNLNAEIVNKNLTIPENYYFVNTKTTPSDLLIKHDATKNLDSVKRLNGTIISDNILSKALGYDGATQHYGLLVADNTPVVAYAEESGTGVKVTLKDFTGVTIDTETYPSTSLVNIKFNTTFTIGDNDDDHTNKAVYQKIDLSSDKSIYIRVMGYEDEELNVLKIDKETYEEQYDAYINELIPLKEVGYDLDGYIKQTGSGVTVYNKNKKQIGVFSNIISGGSITIAYSEGMYIIQRLKEDELLVNNPSYDQYKVKAYQFSFKTGKFTVLDDLDFLPTSSRIIYDKTGKYIAGSVVTYKKIKDNGEVEDITLSSVVKDKLEVSGSSYSVLPVNNSYVYSTDKNTYIYSDGSTYYQVTKNSITPVDIDDVITCTADEMLYTRADGKYVLDKFNSTDDIICEYYETDTINGQNIIVTSMSYDALNLKESYVLSDGTKIDSEYFDYLTDYGLVVTENSVKLFGTTDTITTQSGYKITDISRHKISKTHAVYTIYSYNETTLDYKTQYFEVTITEVKDTKKK